MFNICVLIQTIAAALVSGIHCFGAFLDLSIPTSILEVSNKE